MPYQTNSGTYELAGRTSHAEAAIRALADTRTFHVPAEHIANREEIEARIRSRASFPALDRANRLRSAIAVDGSRVLERVRSGLPSVVYGFAQTAAVYIDLDVLEHQRAERFTDPSILQAAINSALVSVDLPCAGAYSRSDVSIEDSWRELINQIFMTKRVEVNRLDTTLVSLLFSLHGGPGNPAKTVPINCVTCTEMQIPIPMEGGQCPTCTTELFATDTLRIHEEVLEEGTNESALGRLMSVVELLVLFGLVELLWTQDRKRLTELLFILDGPLAMYGPPAPLRQKALAWMQAAASSTAGDGPYVVGIEKSGSMVDYASQLAHQDVMKPGELLIVDQHILRRVTNTSDPAKYGKETYWGRKFVYRSLDGQILVLSIPPVSGLPYDSIGGQPGPAEYPTLWAILDVLDRTESSMYRNGIIPVALAHGKAAFPIGVGTDVLRLVASTRLGVAPPSPTLNTAP